MTVAATLVGTALSLAAIGWTAATDPKRRRAFRLPPRPRHPAAVRAAWTGVALCGLGVALWGGAGGLFVWGGAVIVSGWCLVAPPPRPRAAGSRAPRRHPARPDAPRPDAPADGRGQLAAESGLDHAPGEWRSLKDARNRPLY